MTPIYLKIQLEVAVEYTLFKKLRCFQNAKKSHETRDNNKFDEQNSDFIEI